MRKILITILLLTSVLISGCGSEPNICYPTNWHECNTNYKIHEGVFSPDMCVMDGYNIVDCYVVFETLPMNEDNNIYEENDFVLINNQSLYDCEEGCVTQFKESHGSNTIGVDNFFYKDCFKKCYEKKAQLLGSIDGGI